MVRKYHDAQPIQSKGLCSTSSRQQVQYQSQVMNMSNKTWGFLCVGVWWRCEVKSVQSKTLLVVVVVVVVVFVVYWTSANLEILYFIFSHPWQIDNGNPPYLKWISDVTMGGKEKWWWSAFAVGFASCHFPFSVSHLCFVSSWPSWDPWKLANKAQTQSSKWLTKWHHL